MFHIIIYTAVANSGSIMLLAPDNRRRTMIIQFSVSEIEANIARYFYNILSHVTYSLDQIDEINVRVFAINFNF